MVGFDDIPEAAAGTPPLTTVAQPIVEKGRLAAKPHPRGRPGPGRGAPGEAGGARFHRETARGRSVVAGKGSSSFTCRTCAGKSAPGAAHYQAAIDRDRQPDPDPGDRLRPFPAHAGMSRSARSPRSHGDPVPPTREAEPVTMFAESSCSRCRAGHRPGAHRRRNPKKLPLTTRYLRLRRVPWDGAPTLARRAIARSGMASFRRSATARALAAAQSPRRPAIREHPRSRSPGSSTSDAFGGGSTWTRTWTRSHENSW